MFYQISKKKMYLYYYCDDDDKKKSKLLTRQHKHNHTLSPNIYSMAFISTFWR